jgi:hypothetical protein
MKNCLLFHKWREIPLVVHSRYGEYPENYRYCTRCGKWQIILALHWFDSNPPRLTEDERKELNL